MNRYIVGLGEALWDMLPEGKKIGGAPANFAYHTSQFGYDSIVVSAVGDDDLGDELLEVFDSKGLQYLIERTSHPTGSVAVELDASGVPGYEIEECVAWDNIPFTPQLHELALNTLAVCFGTLAQRSATSRQTINRFLDSMPTDEECYKIFDINLRQDFFLREIIHSSLERCNILKINDEELDTIGKMFGYNNTDQQALCMKILNEYSLKMVILTCGVNGSYVFTPSDHSFLATPKVEVVDTVGAGDSFTATFIAALLNGESVREAHVKAVSISAFVCTQHGAMPTLPEALK